MTKSPKARNTNAVSHGLRSNRTVLPGRESEEDWRAFLADIVDSIEPVCPLERALARKIASLLWRMERVPRYQVEEANRAGRSGADPLDRLFDDRVLSNVLRAEAHLSRELHRALDQLLTLQLRRRDEEIAAFLRA